MSNSYTNNSSSSGPVFVKNRLALTITAVILAASAISWIISYYLMPLMMMPQEDSTMTMTTPRGAAAIVSSLSPSVVGFFAVVWVVGMVAMMFPAMLPTVLFYNKVATKQESNPSQARAFGTPLFLSGYLIVYALLGFLAYVGIYEVINSSMGLEQLAFLSVIASSAILITTGVYQFTSLKSRCLSNCVSPIGFFAVHYSKGLFGSMKMGLRHGFYCVGCCWAFMLVMLAVGAMSIPVMAILAGIIASEKVLVRGAVWFNRAVGISFVAFGAAVAAFPGILAMI